LIVKSKKKTTNKKKKMKKAQFGSAQGAKNLSQDGNAALSFKSMKSYILGDLDISGEDEQENSDFSSFEISSNSSAKSVVSERNESSSKKLDPVS